MSCEAYEAAIQALVDGALDESGKAQLEAHVRTCASCRALLDDLRQIRRTARSLEPLAPPAGAWPRLAARLREQAEGRRAAARPWGGIRGLAAAAALVVAVGASAYFLLRGGAPPAPPGLQVPSQPVAPTEGNANATDLVESVEAELKLAQQHYEAALSTLDRMAQAGNPGVDTQLAQTLRQNVAVVDRAIADSRAALTTDPQSEPARESLFEALRRKVGLLQDTIALVNEMRKGNQAGAASIVEGLKKS
jgi:predicted anti-sigma-YlaC factor YlaD